MSYHLVFLALSNVFVAGSQIEFNVIITDKNKGQTYETKKQDVINQYYPFTPQHYTLAPKAQSTARTRDLLNITNES